MKIDRISLLKFTFPLILSGLAEQLILLTDVFLISYKEDVYLASIGLIDAFLLCTLSSGFALNDTFQNFYSRNKQKSIIIKNVFENSLRIFIIHSVILATLFSGFAYSLSIIIDNSVYELFLDNIPIIIPLVVLNYISLSMNAYLLGLGKTKIIGLISIIIILSNGLLGYLLLFEITTNINPLSIILYSSIIAEIIGILLMFRAIRKLTPKFKEKKPLKKQLLRTIRKASYYPALSDFSFHIGSFILFLYCSTYFELDETALMTLFIAYWGVLLVPSEAFSETALNLFSTLHSTKQNASFKKLCHNIVISSLITSSVILAALLFIDSILFESDSYRIILIFITSILVLLGTFNKIYSTSLIVKLKNNLFAISKVIYGSIAIILIISLSLFFENGAIAILISLLIAQLGSFLFLKNKSYRIWSMSLK